MATSLTAVLELISKAVYMYPNEGPIQTKMLLYWRGFSTVARLLESIPYIKFIASDPAFILRAVNVIKHNPFADL